MEKDKLMLYFRGKCYRNTRYNRFVGKLLTLCYKFKCIFKVFILSSLVFFSCGSPDVDQDTTFSDSIFVDSCAINGHSYIYVYDKNQYIEFLHNPDCYCRYNRTFVVIKRK